LRILSCAIVGDFLNSKRASSIENGTSKKTDL
jgi:hypothetical protein